MLYQWELGGGELDAVFDTYLTHHAQPEVADNAALVSFAQSLVRGSAQHRPQIDALIEQQAENWRLSRMAVTDRIILRLAVYEFLHGGDTPRPVVIDEAVELAKRFSGDEAAGFVNGVLDGIRRRLEEKKLYDTPGKKHEDHGEH